MVFGRKSKLKKEFDEQLRSLMIETKEEWEQARGIERYLNDYDEEVIIRRKIAESKHFYLYKEAKARRLGNN
nr:YaaL family protein [Sporosarcina sp. JAI121]